MPSLNPTPRNALLAVLADSAGAVDAYAQRPNQAMPMGKANPILSLLADFLSVGDIATTLDRASYGEPITNFGKANVPALRPETANAFMTLAPLAASAAPIAAKGARAGLANALAPKSINGLAAAQRGLIAMPGSSNIDDAMKFASRVSEVSPSLSAKVIEDAGGSVYVQVFKNKLTKAGLPHKTAKPDPLGFKARFADHPSYWSNTISSDPITQNSVDDILGALKFRLSRSPEDFAGYRAAHFDPGLRSGLVSDVELNRNVLANGGSDYLREANKAPFSLLDMLR